MYLGLKASGKEKMLNKIETEERYLESLARIKELMAQAEHKPLGILDTVELSTLDLLVYFYENTEDEDKHYPIDIEKELLKDL